MVDVRWFWIAALVFVGADSGWGRPVWVWLDPPVPTVAALREVAAATEALDPHRAARLRRARMAGMALLELRDLPVAPARIAAIEACGLRIRHSLPWVSAVSCEGSPEALVAVEDLPFVRGLTPVGRWIGPTTEERPRLGALGTQTPDFSAPLEALGVPLLHEEGLDGRGVRVAVLDTGFDMRHSSIAHAPVLEEWDFINNDGDTGYEPSDLESCLGCDEAQAEGKQVSHGTAVVSLVVGVDAEGTGDPIGAATGASLLLAKTENNFEETRIEEDHWAAAVMWAEALGADIVTSSLGYLTFDNGIGDHDPERDLDGRTTVAALAATAAARRGLVVCTAMGNAGPGSRSLVTPADADSILSVGATNVDGSTARFSSRGPTSDHRMKPDLVAPGVGLSVANYAHGAGIPGAALYKSFSGTSGATPLVAGAVALVLQARETASGLEVRDHVLASGDRAGEVGCDEDEDNSRGVGWPNVAVAAGYEDGNGSTTDPCAPVDPPGQVALRAYPQPWYIAQTPTLTTTVDLPVGGDVRLGIYNAAGELVRRLSGQSLPPGQGQALPSLAWDGANELGQPVASGMYRLVLTTPSGKAQIGIARIR